jgi:hypothetical protein
MLWLKAQERTAPAQSLSRRPEGRRWKRSRGDKGEPSLCGNRNVATAARIRAAIYRNDIRDTVHNDFLPPVVEKRAPRLALPLGSEAPRENLSRKPRTSQGASDPKSNASRIPAPYLVTPPHEQTVLPPHMCHTFSTFARRKTHRPASGQQNTNAALSGLPIVGAPAGGSGGGGRRPPSRQAHRPAVA